MESKPIHGFAVPTGTWFVTSPRSVLLDIQSWRPMILAPYSRLGPGVFIVCVVIEKGDLAVMEGKAPMLRRIQIRKDPSERTMDGNV